MLRSCWIVLIFFSTSSWSFESIEEITVTAHRMPTASVPRIEILEREAIEQRGRSVGPDVLATLPGLAISRTGAFGGVTQIRVRGAEANHLQVLIDGIEVNDPAIGSEYAFAHLNLTGVERIEFLPGAQSALWGSDAVAGVLNLLTRPLGKRREMTITGGSFDTLQTRFQFANSTENGYYSLAASRYETDGTNISLTGTEDDGYDNTMFHFNGGLTGEKYGVQLVVRRTDSETETDPAPFPVSVPVDGDNRTDLKQTAAKLEVSADFMEGRWLQSLSVSYLKTENDNRMIGLVTDEVDGKRLKFGIKQHFRLNEHQTFTAILEREEEKFTQRGTPSFFGDPNQ
ncbi:MAG: TonB-dependent receptor plug domain-containing protein, partial [Gammaproteobacteria bacterium]|nr:TonB-dependent receptor plug domain-containing protein [Gammaproteobacteria bacterium]